MGTKFSGSKKATVAAIKPKGIPSGNVAGNPGKSLPSKKIPGPGVKGK